MRYSKCFALTKKISYILPYNIVLEFEGMQKCQDVSPPQFSNK